MSRSSDACFLLPASRFPLPADLCSSTSTSTPTSPSAPARRGPRPWCQAAVARGFGALACTDTNGVWGAVEFQRAAESAGVRPMLGAHLVAGGEETVVLATNEPGWGALCRAITAIHWADGTDRSSHRLALPAYSPPIVPA